MAVGDPGRIAFPIRMPGALASTSGHGMAFFSGPRSAGDDFYQ